MASMIRRASVIRSGRCGGVYRMMRSAKVAVTRCRPTPLAMPGYRSARRVLAFQRGRGRFPILPSNPGGEGAGEPANAYVLADLRPVVPCSRSDRADQFPGGPADRRDALPFRRVPVPPCAGLRFLGSLVQ
jgi:hypothetical protein